MKNIKFILVLIAFSGIISRALAQSGTCGDNVTWNLTGSHLSFSGGGEMWDYWWHDLMSPNPPPWKDYVANIETCHIGDGITNIGSGCFHYCENLRSVYIPLSVRKIGDRAFQGCASLLSANFSQYVTYIGQSAFEGCASLTSIDLPIRISEIKIGTFAYSGLTSIIIPNNVKTIGLVPLTPSTTNGAFEYCENLSSITIPNGVTRIGSYTFRGCKSLTSIRLPNSLKEMWASFEGCDALASIYIPNGIPSTGSYTTCKNLKLVQCNSMVPPPASIAVFNNEIYGVCVLKVPTKAVSLYQETEPWKNFVIEGGGFLVTPKSENPQYGFANGNNIYSSGKATAVVEAIAYEGYHFVHWTKEGEVVSTANPYSFDVTEDVELVANFEEGEVGIAEIWRTTSIQVYPNPTSGQLIISLPNPSEGGAFEDSKEACGSSKGACPLVKAVEIYDIVGRVITNYQLSIVNSQLHIDVSGLASGVYFLRINDMVGRFVKE